ADPAEALGAQEPLAALALAPLQLLAAERAPLHGLALAVREALLEDAVIGCARVLVGQHLVGRGQLLEGARQERSELAHVLAKPGVGMVAARAIEVRAADGAAVRLRSHPEQIVKRDVATDGVERAEL